MIRTLLTLFLLAPVITLAEDYPVFDGQYYNHLFYPNIDILEWGEPLHLQFQIYNKSMPIDIGGVVVKDGPTKSFLISYDINERGERLCRRVAAPPTFKEGQKLYFYKDSKERDRNIIYVSAQPMNGLPTYTPKTTSNCIEKQANVDTPKAEPIRRIPASQGGPDTVFGENRKEPKAPVVEVPREGSARGLPKKKDPKEDIKYQPVDNGFSWF